MGDIVLGHGMLLNVGVVAAEVQHHLGEILVAISGVGKLLEQVVGELGIFHQEGICIGCRLLMKPWSWCQLSKHFWYSVGVSGFLSLCLSYLSYLSYLLLYPPIN